MRASILDFAILDRHTGFDWNITVQQRYNLFLRNWKEILKMYEEIEVFKINIKLAVQIFI